MAKHQPPLIASSPSLSCLTSLSPSFSPNYLALHFHVHSSNQSQPSTTSSSLPFLSSWPWVASFPSSPSGSMKRLSFLHVYHHSMVVIMCYICLDSAQSSVPMVLITNCVVHVVMYTYYLLCTLGMHPKWKKMVTDFQLVQFRLSFLIMAMLVFYHFTASGCSGILSWCFNAAFNVSLLYLFSDFHAKSYSTNAKVFKG
ncbi:hypothetical protein Gotri_021702, partial [Gossypium trilobum]|nr:hypothetical protein [Gossypium trilobum]